MFNDMFATQDDLLNKDQNPTLPFVSSRPKNCAFSLELPPLQREEKQFAGLRNQGATCYLNSLIQALYMSPEFRREILNLPLFKEDLEHPSNFVDTNNKRILLLAIQKLFGEMQGLNLRSVSTEEMTKSFGWEGNEQNMQQDIQEALRVIFDYLERALFGTSMHDCISKNYQGLLVNHISCLKCGKVKERNEFFYDLMIQVKDFTHLEDSLLNLITPEQLDGANQYFCEICNEKVDALKGIKIRKFPKILIFSLNRFQFDYEILDRVKINSNFAFSMEFNCHNYQEISNSDPTDNEYELCGVIIHRGTAYQGHYHAYIRDVANEGNWEALMKGFDEKREENKKKLLEEANLQKQSKKMEENLNKMELESKHQSNEEKEKETIVIEIEKTEPEPQETKEEKKGQNQKKKGGKKQQPKADKEKKKGNKEEKNKKDDKKKEDNDYLKDEFFDELEFPIPFNNPNLAKNWFDFNDSCVTPIPINRLQKQYGGSNENAYLLIYRQKKLGEAGEPIVIPDYLMKVLNVQNEVFEKERMAYKEAEKHIEILILGSKEININTLEFKTPNPETFILKINVEEDFSKVLSKLAYEKMTELSNLKLVELHEHGNKLIQFKRVFGIVNIDDKVKDLDLGHLSKFLLLRNEETEFTNYINSHLGEEAVPIKINIFYGPKNYTIMLYLNNTLEELKTQVAMVLDLMDIPLFLRVMQEEASVLLNVNLENDFKTLKELKLSNGSDIIVNIEEGGDEDENEEITKNENGLNLEEQNLRSILVERDDTDDISRYFVNLDWTLTKLFDYLREKLTLDEKIQRRLRKLKGNSLFYEEDLPKSLRDLEFEEGGIRLRVERGPWPKFGNVALKILIQSKQLTQKENLTKNLVATPITTIQDLIKDICQPLNIDPEKHRLYKTDWLEEPIEAIAKVDKSLHMNSIKNNDILILRDIDNLIPKEILKFGIHLTKTGNPDDSEYVDVIQIKEEDNLITLKQKILSMPQMKQFSQLSLRRLRVREIKKDLFFGRILRNEEKPLKKLNIKTYSLVCQILEKEENLEEDDVVLMFRKRIIGTRSYGEYVEKIFFASKEPKINDLKRFLLDSLELKCSEEEIELAKYISHEFNWLHLHIKHFEEIATKRKKTGKAKKRKRDGNAKKNAKNKKDNAQKNIENLKKMPYMLNDGDIIGYRLEAENVEKNDDFQTFEDEELKMKIKELKNVAAAQGGGASKKNDSVGFKILIDL